MSDHCVTTSYAKRATQILNDRRAIQFSIWFRGNFFWNDSLIWSSDSHLIAHRFGELMRKMWNPRNFKAHVSPHEMLQAVVLWSNKQFQITHQGDPIDFLSWFLHTTHRALRGNKDPNSSIINKSFLGQMKIYSRKIPSTDLDETQKSLLLATEDYQERSEETNFLYLTCDLPAPPLFIDEFRENIIPQVS